MSDLLQRVSELKTQAKNRRDLGRYERAVSLLSQAIDLASDEYETASVSELRATLASELADCWGIRGGVERRWALDSGSDTAQRVSHLRRSIDAYDHGYHYESDHLLGSATSTYNRLNRLIVRILLDPGCLTASVAAADEESSGAMKVRAELEAVAAQIDAQPTDSVWAAADLALLDVLLERKDAASAYIGFQRKNPPDFACQSALEVVTPLAAAGIPIPSIATELGNAELLLIALRDRSRTS